MACRVCVLTFHVLSIRSCSLRPRRSVRTAMAHGARALHRAHTPSVDTRGSHGCLGIAWCAEINMYAIVQKEGLGLDKAVEEVKYR